MSEERILLKFAVGQRVVKQGEDSRFEGEVVACFVKRNHKTVRYVVENDDGTPTVYIKWVFERLRIWLKAVPDLSMAQATLRRRSATDRSALAMAATSASEFGVLARLRGSC